MTSQVNGITQVKKIGNNNISVGLSQELNISTQSARSKSLNRGIRQKEFQRITNENEQLLRRLQDRQSFYNVFQWEIDRKKQEQILKKLCYYPPNFFRKSKNKSKRLGLSLLGADPNQEIFQYYQTNFKQSMPMLEPIDDSEEKIDEENKLTQSNNILPQLGGERKSSANVKEISDANRSYVDMNGEKITQIPYSAQPQKQDYRQSFSRDDNGNLKIANISNNGFNRQMIQTQGNQMQKNLSFSVVNNKKNFTSQPRNDLNQSPTTQNANKSFNLVARKRPPPLNIGYNEMGIDQFRQVLYRNFHQVDQQIYLVEISRNARKVFILIFPNFEQPDVYQYCVLAEKQAQRLMSESNNMFEEFVKRFYLRYGKLQIDGFHTKPANPNSSKILRDDSRQIKSVSPIRNRGSSQQSIFNVNPRVKNAYGFMPLDQDQQRSSQYEKQDLDNDNMSIKIQNAQDYQESQSFIQKQDLSFETRQNHEENQADGLENRAQSKLQFLSTFNKQSNYANHKANQSQENEEDYENENQQENEVIQRNLQNMHPNHNEDQDGVTHSYQIEDTKSSLMVRKKRINTLVEDQKSQISRSSSNSKQQFNRYDGDSKDRSVSVLQNSKQTYVIPLDDNENYQQDFE
ncbi:UNKNOWN [Stylonychia lemnae]|uniref:Uncharacterized protein n=1 Tax=Stylonychia lemnae TaxID=5949 RepID=A0A078AGM6_STYLE|nr:UNKNOWN [Stylonychia lemnae]|eukprot:CDW80981.1 UNKNOWN [Stylonychia lemnae]